MPPAGRAFDLGQRKRGEIVEITLRGSAANVLLVDSTNQRNFEGGRRTSYIGGLVKRSPHQMVIPRSGHWHVLVTMDGLRGLTNATVRVCSRPPGTPRSAIFVNWLSHQCSMRAPAPRSSSAPTSCRSTSRAA